MRSTNKHASRPSINSKVQKLIEICDQSIHIKLAWILKIELVLNLMLCQVNLMF